MEKILEKLSKPLTKEDVELRVGSNSAKSFTLLLYKTARTDMKRLNDVCPTWSNKHEIDSKNSVKCSISLYSPAGFWVTREDVGSESNTEKEKGSYSDSFKRAGTRWGIGLELYNTDTIRVMWEMKEDTKKSTQYKKAYKPENFWSNNLELTQYQVVDDKPQVEIKYDGKVVFTNISGSKQAEKTMDITPHNETTTKEILDNAEMQLNAITTLEEFEVLKEELRSQAKYFSKRKDETSMTTLKTMIDITEERLK